jgi:FixJ family two-component response regulator
VRAHKDAEIARKEAKLATELAAAAEARKQAEADAVGAAENRRASAAVMETAQSELARAQAERKQLERDRDREATQLALLVRAANDDNGLDLRPSGDGFSMAKSRMTQPEKAAFESPWSATMHTIGRKVAEALEQVRRALLRLADKEARLERGRQEHERSAAAHREAVSNHQNAVRDLNARIANFNEKEKQIEERLAKASETVRFAEGKEREAAAAMRLQQHWLTVIAATASEPHKITIQENGQVAVAPQMMASLSDLVRSDLRKDAPDWVKNVVKQREALAQAKGQAEAAEAEWKRKSEAVSTVQERIEKSRKVLDAIVTGNWDVTIADGFMAARHNSDSESRNVHRIPLADMEPSLLHAARSFLHLSATTGSVLELRDDLKKERSALVKLQPERASQIEEEQQRTDDKIGRVLQLPPGWESGHRHLT